MIFAVCPNPAIDTYLFMNKLELKSSTRVEKLQRYAGGKGVHVALAVAEMGYEVSLLAFWGGRNGAWVKQECEEKGIACYGIELEGETRSCYTLKTNDSYTDTEILEPGPTIQPKEYDAFLAEFEKQAAQAKVVIMSGSWPQNSPQHAWADLVTICNRLDIPHILDATGVQLMEAMKKRPFGLHLNRREAMEYFGEKHLTAILDKTQETIALMAVTDGSKGLYLRFREHKYHSNTKLENIISAVGSGDCLTAGLGISLLNNETVKEMAAMATACGAANCLREEIGMLHRSDVMSLIKRIEIEDL
jgi:tagatose 6-phosphate kinase